MSLFVVDVESDGPIVGVHSMVCFGAVKVSDLSKTFYGQTEPISKEYVESALNVSGFTREEHMKFQKPIITMEEFTVWVMDNNDKGTIPVLISDNNGYDACWINYYMHRFVGSNVFGWSSRRIGDLYGGLIGNASESWKHLRKTKHTHHPVDDAMGNAEVILHMKNVMGLKIKL